MIYFKLTISILTFDCLLFAKLCNGVSYVTDDSPVVAFYNKCKLKKFHILKIGDKKLTFISKIQSCPIMQYIARELF